MIEMICYFHFVMMLFGFLINEIPYGDLTMTPNGKSRHESTLCFYVFFICILGDVMLFEVLLLTVIHFGDEKHVETFRGKQYFS